MSEHGIDPNEHPVRANRGIVIVVVTLGILIVLGLGGLVYGIAMKAGKLGEDEQPVVGEVEVSSSAPSSPALSSSAPSPPAGYTVRSMTAADGTLYLHLILPDGREVVRAYDRTGEQVYEIEP